jgi:hypothetical protein
MNLPRLVHSGLNVAFNLGPPLVRAGSYIRPASFNPATGATTGTEILSLCSALIAPLTSARYLGFITVLPGAELLIIRASELLSIPDPTEGDYFVETLTGIRRNIRFGRLDFTGEYYSFQSERTLDQDWGDLTPATTFDDWGDLTPNTTSDDWGPLF